MHGPSWICLLGFYRWAYNYAAPLAAPVHLLRGASLALADRLKAGVVALLSLPRLFTGTGLGM